MPVHVKNLVPVLGGRTEVAVRTHSVEIMACVRLVVVVHGSFLILESVGRLVSLGRQAAVMDFSVIHGVIVRE